MGVGADDDRGGDGSESGDGLQAGGELLGQGAELAVVVLEQRGLLHDGDSEAAGLAAHDRGGVGHCGAGGPPGGDGADLGVGQRGADIDVEVDGAQQGGEGVAVGGALMVDDRTRSEQDTQR